MKVDTVVIGDFQTNSYIVTSSDSSTCLVIDIPAPAGDLITRLKSLGVSPELVVLTHAHIDHIGGLQELKQSFLSVKVAAGAGAAAMLDHPSMNLSVYFKGAKKFGPADIELDEGDEVKCGEIVLQTLLVEGHAPGSICLLSGEGSPVVFSGDTLFAGSIGRTDLPGGDTELLTGRIRDAIMSLPDETIVYPGHGPSTSVGAERNNPFLV